MLNKTILLGRLVDNPVINEEKEFGRFTLAINGAKEEDTVFIDCIAFKNKAISYLHKGDRILVEGRLHTRKYTTKDGQSRTAFEVIVTTTEFVEVKNSEAVAPVQE